MFSCGVNVYVIFPLFTVVFVMVLLLIVICTFPPVTACPFAVSVAVSVVLLLIVVVVGFVVMITFVCTPSVEVAVDAL